MKISILTLFPKMFEGFLQESIVKRAQDKKLVEIEIIDLRSFAKNKYRSVDDRPYGGGAGMILRVDILAEAINKTKNKQTRIVLTSTRGKLFTQQKAREFSKLKHLLLIAGHYEGIDERIVDYIDEEISLGDFVMTGGEIAVGAIVDAIVRLIPGVLKKEEATQVESFFQVPVGQLIAVVGEDEILTKFKKDKVKSVYLLEYPQYTRPEEFKEKKVPSVLINGNHREIANWRLKMAYEETKKKRPDLLQ